MTKKRFTICVDSNNLKSLWDDERTEEEPLLWLTRSGRIGGIDNVCELLNELNDENQQLKHHLELYQPNKDERSNFDLNLCCEENNKLLEENKKLKKENEQLKQEMGDLGTVHAEEINKIEDEFDKENLRLIKEIKQLKADNNRLVNETARIVAEHQGRVLDLIDEMIEKYSGKYENYVYSATEVLKCLRDGLTEQ